jgi:hypothetical protein
VHGLEKLAPDDTLRLLQEKNVKFQKEIAEKTTKINSLQLELQKAEEKNRKLETELVIISLCHIIIIYY